MFIRTSVPPSRTQSCTQSDIDEDRKHLLTHTHTQEQAFSPSESPSQKEMGWMSTKIALSEDISIKMEVIFNKK